MKLVPNSAESLVRGSLGRPDERAASGARTRVKICGITRPADALAAARFGADAIGLVFYAGSPRAVDVDAARAIVRTLPPFVAVVGLFVNPRPGEIDAVTASVSIDLLQFHGDETPAECAAAGKPYIKALPVREGLDLAAMARDYADARGLLLDTWHKDLKGGTGETFNWSLVPAGLEAPLVLAGGLDPANVGEAIRQVRPYAVDVSGGVEQSKGIKDADKIAAFMRGVYSA